MEDADTVDVDCDEAKPSAKQTHLYTFHLGCESPKGKLIMDMVIKDNPFAWKLHTDYLSGEKRTWQH